MTKNAFTLAEVLITLGIVGTIAAITLPSLMTNTTTAQIGPKLAKAVSVFEQANEALLNDNAVDKLSETGFASSSDSYGNALSNYLKITNQGNGNFLSKDGIEYSFTINATISPANGSAHSQRVGDVVIDINGATAPNASATDIFYFSLWNDGSLRPKGATGWEDGSQLETTRKIICNQENIEEDICKGKGIGDEIPINEEKDRVGGSEHWKTQCDINTIPTATGAEYCAGHVFENNLKVLYK